MKFHKVWWERWKSFKQIKKRFHYLFFFYMINPSMIFPTRLTRWWSGGNGEREKQPIHSLVDAKLIIFIPSSTILKIIILFVQMSHEAVQSIYFQYEIRFSNSMSSLIWFYEFSHRIWTIDLTSAYFWRKNSCCFKLWKMLRGRSSEILVLKMVW